MATDSKQQRPVRDNRPVLTTSMAVPLAIFLAALILDFIILAADWLDVLHLPDAAWLTLVIMLPLLTAWTVFYTWAGRSWRLYMPPWNPQGTRAQRKAARRISRRWSKMCPQIFAPKKCATGTYQLPGIKRMRFLNGDLLIDLAFPIVRYSVSELSGEDTLAAFRDAFGMHEVAYERRDGNTGTYRIIATDTMSETHYARIDD